MQTVDVYNMKCMTFTNKLCIELLGLDKIQKEKA